MGKRRKTNRRNMRRRNTVKRKTMKRKTMKRKTMKRNTMKRKTMKRKTMKVINRRRSSAPESPLGSVQKGGSATTWSTLEEFLKDESKFQNKLVKISDSTRSTIGDYIEVYGSTDEDVLLGISYGSDDSRETRVYSFQFPVKFEEKTDEKSEQTRNAGHNIEEVDDGKLAKVIMAGKKFARKLKPAAEPAAEPDAADAQ